MWCNHDFKLLMTSLHKFLLTATILYNNIIYHIVKTLCSVVFLVKLASSCTLSNDYLKPIKSMNEFPVPHREMYVQIFENYFTK